MCAALTLLWLHVCCSDTAVTTCVLLWHCCNYMCAALTLLWLHVYCSDTAVTTRVLLWYCCDYMCAALILLWLHMCCVSRGVWGSQHLHDVLDVGGPAWHLVRVLGGPLLPVEGLVRLVVLATAALQHENKIQSHKASKHAAVAGGMMVICTILPTLLFASNI